LNIKGPSHLETIERRKRGGVWVPGVGAPGVCTPHQVFEIQGHCD
jgi:hypothetical protein